MTEPEVPPGQLDDVLVQAQLDAVHAAFQAADTADEVAAVAAQVRAVVDWLERAHGAEAVRVLLVATLFDLAEAFAAIGSAEGRTGHEVADGWSHDVPAPPEP
jgi:hypothetical protein